jgi:hemerythrin-like domain-containing protein
MLPTDILKDEHRVIEQVLTCLERIADDCAAQRILDGYSALQALDFFRTFADGCHHHKEEAHLFPALEAKGFPPKTGPTAVMRAEHTEGRDHIQAMNSAVRDATRGDSAAVEHLSNMLRLTCACSASTLARRITASSQWPMRPCHSPKMRHW